MKAGKTPGLVDLDGEFKPPPDSAFMYDFYTDPQFRREDLSSKALNKMIYDSVIDGIQEIFIDATDRNFVSETLIEKTGLKMYRIFVKSRFLWIVKKKEL